MRKARADFDAALDDDLNTSEARGALFGAVREVNPAIERGRIGGEALSEARELLAEADAIFAFLPKEGLAARSVTREVAGQPYEVTALGGVPDGIVDAIVARQQARKDRDFAEADRLRDEIAGAGYVVDDIPGGARVKPAG